MEHGVPSIHFYSIGIAFEGHWQSKEYITHPLSGNRRRDFFICVKSIVQIKDFLSRKIMNKIVELFLTKSVPVDLRE